ncbi:MAG: hypothetical protein HC849_15860 [Oscillatoriales cyanobacterium RU_3_3]|nr:hypothetical protein [Oscillatoriales cyanobacterium RU_3_3]
MVFQAESRAKTNCFWPDNPISGCILRFRSGRKFDRPQTFDSRALTVKFFNCFVTQNICEF